MTWLDVLMLIGLLSWGYLAGVFIGWFVDLRPGPLRIPVITSAFDAMTRCIAWVIDADTRLVLRMFQTIEQSLRALANVLQHAIHRRTRAGH